MRSVLTVINDENLMSRIRIAQTDKTIRYFYAGGGEEAIHLSEDYEIAVCILDFRLPIIGGGDLCEAILNNNSKTEIILIFDEQDIKAVLAVYNSFHISKLICKQNLVLEEIPKLVEGSLHMYNRLDEIKQIDKKRNKINDKYLKPMHEMSSLLNERMNGYQQVIHVFNDCIKFISSKNEKTLKAFSGFVDRIINDYIQVYMVRQPEPWLFLDSLNMTYNKPEEKKYFRLINDVKDISTDNAADILMAANLLTISFDTLYKIIDNRDFKNEDELIKSICTHSLNLLHSNPEFNASNEMAIIMVSILGLIMEKEINIDKAVIDYFKR